MHRAKGVFTSLLAHVQVVSHPLAREMVAENYLMQWVLELKMPHLRNATGPWELYQAPEADTVGHMLLLFDVHF